MLSVVDALEIIDTAESLATQRKFGNLLQFLGEIPEDFLEAEPTLGYLSAYAQYMSGKEVSARQSLHVLQEHFIGEKGRLYRRIVNLRGIVEVELGNLQEAERYLVEAQWLAEGAGDQRYIAYATLNRGIVKEINGFPGQAISAFERARVAFQKLGDQSAIAGCAHNIGMAYRRLTDLLAAESQFAIAIEYFEKNGSIEELLASRLENALVLAMRGEVRLADSAARLALKLSEELGNERLTAEAARVLGSTARYGGDLKSARAFLRRALAAGQLGQVRLLQAEVLIELSTVEQMEGQHDEAGNLLWQAAEIFMRMGAVDRAAQLIGRHR